MKRNGGGKQAYLLGKEKWGRGGEGEARKEEERPEIVEESEGGRDSNDQWGRRGGNGLNK